MRGRAGRAWLAAAALAAMSVASSAQQEEESLGSRFLRERLAPVEGQGDLAVEDSIIEEIGFLAEMSLGDSARDYYEGLVGRWEKCATERSIPVLEDLITKMAAFKRERRGQLPWGIFGTLDRRVHELWFRLKTRDMLPEEKAKVALWGIMEEGAPVPFNRELAMDLLPQIGVGARKLLYEFMRRPADGDWDDMTVGVLSSVIGGRPGVSPLSPSEEEIQLLLDAKGTLGQMAVIGNLASAGRTDPCVQPLLEMVSSGEEDKVNSALNSLRYLDAYRGRILPVLLDVAGRRIMFTTSRWGESSPDGMRSRLFNLLGRIGKDARAVTLFRDYITRMSSQEAWLEDAPSENLIPRQMAVSAAYRWLKKWGELPVKGDAGKDEEEAVEDPLAQDVALESMPPVQESEAEPATPASQGHGTWLLVVVGVLSAMASSVATAAIVLRRARRAPDASA